MSRISRTTRILLAVFGVLVICVVFIGLANETGIILGWLAAAALLLSIAHRWRKTWYFIILLFASFLGAIFLSFLYMEIAQPLAELTGGVDAVQSTGWRVFHVIISNIILLFAPTGIVIGFFGTIVLLVIRSVEFFKKERVPEKLD